MRNQLPYSTAALTSAAALPPMHQNVGWRRQNGVSRGGSEGRYWRQFRCRVLPDELLPAMAAAGELLSEPWRRSTDDHAPAAVSSARARNAS